MRQVKEELGVAQCKPTGKNNNKENGPGEKQLVVSREPHLLWHRWNIHCGVESLVRVEPRKFTMGQVTEPFVFVAKRLGFELTYARGEPLQVIPTVQPGGPIAGGIHTEGNHFEFHT